LCWEKYFLNKESIMSKMETLREDLSIASNLGEKVDNLLSAGVDWDVVMATEEAIALVKMMERIGKLSSGLKSNKLENGVKNE
jgi:hypothetical protein